MAHAPLPPFFFFFVCSNPVLFCRQEVAPLSFGAANAVVDVEAQSFCLNS